MALDDISFEPANNCPAPAQCDFEYGLCGWGNPPDSGDIMWTISSGGNSGTGPRYYLHYINFRCDLWTRVTVLLAFSIASITLWEQVWAITLRPLQWEPDHWSSYLNPEEMSFASVFGICFK